MTFIGTKQGRWVDGPFGPLTVSPLTSPQTMAFKEYFLNCLSSSDWTKCSRQGRIPGMYHHDHQAVQPKEIQQVHENERKWLYYVYWFRAQGDQKGTEGTKVCQVMHLRWDNPWFLYLLISHTKTLFWILYYFGLIWLLFRLSCNSKWHIIDNLFHALVCV